ncbi:GNAT family N-acetyltransferase [Saccharibacillus sp. CPCC 101409]|uniref:GNAT family N-acetyltransferase n=1 Tax=Saccharibacillus sp. CPCC 101409 TaxID=3058041 RepID=UPI0026721ADD|nr:GNAT family N-acetyltransferase [Saccharibacillus sp. CPCC 101409]MDO3410818.1 GNAT family N-acetyltransferase [Saccharibacillus sp. CPCC 101409]
MQSGNINGENDRIQVRPYRPEDRSGAERLLEACGAAGEVGLLPESERKNGSAKDARAWTAERAGEVVGIALLRQKTFHPHTGYLAIRRYPDERGGHAETKLMEALLAERPRMPLQTSFMPGDAPGAEFYERFGFAETRRTFMPALRLSELQGGTGASEPAVGDRLRIASLAELAGNGEALNQIAERARDSYRATHTFNPPGVHPLSVWRRLIEADDVLRAGSFAAFDDADGSAAAFALLHGEEGGSEAELGWLGCAPGQEKAMQKVDEKRMMFCLRSGFDTVSAEIDTTDFYQYPLLERYGFPPSEPLLTYFRVPASRE